MAECSLRHWPDNGGTPQRDSKPKAHIILIPGIGDEPVESWSQVRDRPLLRDLVEKGKPALNVCISILEHHLTTANLEHWEDLDSKAKSLLPKLEELLGSWNSKQRPVLFLCHSLGGIILKRLLVHAHRKGEAAELLIENLAGIVFLGTPHLRESNKPEWEKAAAILELRMLSPPKAVSDENELRQLFHWSQDFEDLGLKARILSTTERKESKKKRGTKLNKLWKESLHIVGTETLARTSSLLEEVVSVDADHNGLCALTEHNTFRSYLIEFCHKTLRETQDTSRKISSTVTSSRPESSRRTSAHSISTNELEMRDPTHNHSQATHQSTDSSPPRPSPEMSMPVEVNLPCYLLNESVAVKNFFGREEVMDEIHDYLVVEDEQGGVSDLKTVAISGMGGIGKTSIAYQFVKTRLKRFDAIFWLNADTAGKLDSSFGKMALELKLQRVEEDRDQVMSRNLVLKWLENPVTKYGCQDTSSPRKARWLLVFDNVDNFELMKGFWPPKGAGSVLITSRKPHARNLTNYTGTDQDSYSQRIELKAFGEEEAQEFLYRLTKKERTHDNEQAARDLARRLQGYPLFLKQFAGYMMNEGTSTFANLLKMYSEESSHGKLFARRPETKDDNYEHTTATVWMLDKLDPDARMVMNVLSLLDPDHIQEDIMTEGIPSIKVRDYPKSYSDYCLALDALYKLSLVSTDVDDNSKTDGGAPASKHSFDLETDSGTQDRLEKKGLDSSLEPDEEIDQQAKSQLSVHRVLQDVSRSQMDKKQQREAFEIAVSLLLIRWKRKERLWHYDREDWPRAEYLYPHVLQVQCHYEAFGREAQENVATVELVSLMNCAGWFDHERGRSRQAKRIFETAEKICMQHLNSDERLMREIHTSLGCVATEINDPDTCYERNKILREMTRAEYPNPKTQTDFEALMVSDNEMGVAEMMMGNTDEASNLFKTALREAHRLRDDSETAKSIYLLASANLGLAQWFKGKYEKASSTLQQAWQYHEKLTDAHEDTGFAPGRIAHALGNVMNSLHHADAGCGKGEALEWYERAYRHYEKTIGKYHHRSADVCHKLAEQYIELGNFDQAHDYIDHALKVFQTRDYYKPERARTGNLKSVLLRREDNDEEADKIYEEAKKLYGEHMTERNKNNPKGKCPEIADFDEKVAFWSR